MDVAENDDPPLSGRPARRFDGPARVLVGLCAAGAVASGLAALHLTYYLWSLAHSKLANPPRTGILLLILALLPSLALALAVLAWRVKTPVTPQRVAASQWSTAFVLLWGGVVAAFLLINYPIPAQAHHVDKFAGGLLVLLLWSLGSLITPGGLGRLVSRSGFRVLEVGLVNLLLFVLLGEATVRLADPLLARSGLFGDKHTPANLKPHRPVRGSIAVTNSQGFRDRERAVERSGGGPRVLALGDSFTWGAGVSYDEAFVTLLERRLQAETAGAEVINLGVPAWGPHEEFHLLKTYGIRFKPDLVVLNFFVGNDIQNKRGDGVVLPDIMVVAGQSYYVHSNGNWLHDSIGPERWYLYHDLNYLAQVGGARLRLALEQRDAAVADRQPLDAPPLVSRRQYVRGIHERSDIYLVEDTPFFRQHLERTQQTLLALRNFLAALGMPLLVTVIPDHVQLDRTLQREYLAGVGVDAARYDFRKPQRLLMAWFKDQGIPAVDLWPAFEQTGDPEPLYFRNDFHLTALGHRLAADTIFPVLREHLRPGDAPEERARQ